jgi:acyl-CoA reductase-like NAD-dependent aldehyde dehydrogenase
VNDINKVKDIKEYRYFAGGEWRTAENHKLFDVFRPYDRGLYARVAAGGRPEAKLAVDAAARAFPAWSQTTPAERARLFFKAAEIVKRRRAEIADILAIETGSTISFATFQQDLVAATIEQAAGWMYLPKGEVLETNIPGSHSIGVRRPLGVVASFTPWNGANVLSWRAVISPVAAGNTVVVKPSELAPISAGIILAQIAEEAGFPAGVINVVTHAPGGASTQPLPMRKPSGRSSWWKSSIRPNRRSKRPIAPCTGSPHPSSRATHIARSSWRRRFWPASSTSTRPQ